MNAQVFDVRDMMRGGPHVVREVCHGAVEQGAVFQREQDGTEVTTALGSMGHGHEVVSCCEIPGRKDGVVGKLCHEGARGSLGIGRGVAVIVNPCRARRWRGHIFEGVKHPFSPSGACHPDDGVVCRDAGKVSRVTQ